MKNTVYNYRYLSNHLKLLCCQQIDESTEFHAIGDVFENKFRVGPLYLDNCDGMTCYRSRSWDVIKLAADSSSYNLVEAATGFNETAKRSPLIVPLGRFYIKNEEVVISTCTKVNKTCRCYVF